MWLIFDLQRVRPQQGANRLEIALVGRPDDLVSSLRVTDVEVEVKYHPCRRVWDETFLLS